MEVQDMYPVLTSTYSFPTGTKVEVRCFMVVEIQRAECPDSFVSPSDVNHAKPSVNVCIQNPMAHGCRKFQLNRLPPPSPPSPPSATHITTTYPAHTHAQSLIRPCPVAVYLDEEYSGVWATHNAIGLIGLAVQPFSRDNMVSCSISAVMLRMILS
jgi:hypothetical protein